MTLADYKEQISDALGSTWTVVNPHCLADIGNNHYIEQVQSKLPDLGINAVLSFKRVSKIPEIFQIYIIEVTELFLHQ